VNALVSFRANSVGNMSPRREERAQVRQAIVSNFRAKLEGIQRTLEKDLIQNAGSASADKAADTSSTQQTKATTKAKEEPPNNELGRDAYLQLLVQQLSNQDPLEPVDNQQMVAQLAQFSALEQMQNLNDSFEGYTENFDSLSGNIDQLNFISAQGLLGKFVEGLDANGKVLSGRVESVHLDGSLVVLTVDGKPMPMSGVIGIATERPEEATPEDAGQGS
jgi:flagellar basal-body rod modification protein FlgD